MLATAKPRVTRSPVPVERPATVAPTSHPARPRQRQRDSLAGRLSRLAFILTTILLIGYGWSLAARQEFTPKDGVGYWLGICGGTALLVQLAYPLRKRLRAMRRFGSAPSWFRAHMILGIAGPLLILYHSNFSLGATNSNIALFAMLIVAVSGIIGRYIYGKIHNGVYGAKSDLSDILAEATSLLAVIEQDVGGAGGSIAQQLTDFGTRVIKTRRSVAVNFAMALWLGLSLPFVRWRILSSVRGAVTRNAGRLNWSRRQRHEHYAAARLHVGNYLESVVKASELSFYERLFAFWHVLHMPLYFLLILTGIVHVVAVHLY